MQKKKISILYPDGDIENFNELLDVTVHDLGLDMIVKKLSNEVEEQMHILRIMSRVTERSEVTKYRCEVFDDIYHNPKMRKDMMVILDKINFLRSYGTFRTDFDKSESTWELLHRLEEINDYIECVEAMSKCLRDVDIKSEGLKKLKSYVDGLYNDNGFSELKKDISELRATTSNLKSITVGINLNARFEASEVGVVSINSKYFTKSGILDNFHDKIVSKEGIRKDTKWKNDFKFQTFDVNDSNLPSNDIAAKIGVAGVNPMLAASATLANVQSDIQVREITQYMDKITNKMISTVVRKLRSVLAKYVTITITDITDLIPEFVYYIRWAEYIETLVSAGRKFTVAKVSEENNISHTNTENVNTGKTNTENASVVNLSINNPGYMRARGIYNLKLAAINSEEHENIITNDLDFNNENLVYILTGANRGGKTTITQAIGLLFVLAQGGIYIPGDEFVFAPCDNIFTHFPADEDKTMDLGRLGEECKRFKEIYEKSTKHSLLLLNETFSTTSFEEGYYIARDAVKAILFKGIRTIYNTHMHKLAFDIEQINNEVSCGDEEKMCASSLVVQSKDGERSYKVKIMQPEGMSYAGDIAKKYGVTYDCLTQNN